jgi:2-amino-4-hydroxy-6-hydroxymethyldihydropteridine diphosphokinase
MKKQINSQLTNYFTPFFPYHNKQNKNYKYEVTIGIGGNIGNTKKIFHKLFIHLKSNAQYYITKTAPILQNPPFGYLEQNDFFNSIIVMQTNNPPFQVLKEMQRYEKRFKRKRSFQDAPRTLDIDLIFIKQNNKNIYINTPKLTLPHHGWSQRESVLIPLSFI